MDKINRGGGRENIFSLLSAEVKFVILLAMSLHQKIKGQVKEAMLAKDQVKLGVVRGLVAAFTNELVAKKRKPDEMLTDEEALGVIKRAAKQRQDSIAQFTAGGRTDLVESEEAELKIIQTYLPQMMSREEIKRVVETRLKEMSNPDKSQMGKIIGAMMKEMNGKAEGTDVKAVVEELLK